ncbi:MAG TPA: hypothetical protein DCS93_08085 [Microscillaceae bacterium]|nr:hypothetical protein [Microscillaceae bacterium]
MKINIYLKVTIFSLVLVLFTGFALYWVSKQNTEESLESQISLNLKNQSDYIINSIDHFIFERQSDIRHIAQDQIFLDPATNRQREKITHRLLKIKSENPLYESFSFFTPQRIRIADTKGLKIGKQHSYTKYWTQLMYKEDAFDVSLSESLGKVVMHFAQNIRDEKGNKIGVVVSRILIKRLYEVFSNVIPRSNEDLKIDLIDTNGRLLYSSSNPQDVLKKKHPKLAILNTYLWGGAGPKLKQHSFEADGNIFFYRRQPGYLTYTGSEWVLVTSIPKTVAYTPAQKLRNRLFRNSIPVIIIAIIIALLFGHYFSRPIVLLAKLAQEYGKGNFLAKINFKSNDERQFLHRSLTWMATQLRSKIEEQASLNANLAQKVKEIEDQNQEIQYQRGQITASISYAERLQKALLPTSGKIKEILPQFFVFFKPRDIVSGDFYWVSKITPNQPSLTSTQAEHDKIVIAAIDCTGHGVPGAFMSVIAYNLLYQIVDVERNTDPVVILHQLNKRMKILLHQNETSHLATDDRVTDGMDLSLCIVDLAAQTLEFAGANRPLFLVRNHQVVEFKGNKWSIGGGIDYFNNRTQRTHDNERLQAATIKLKAEDTVYMFSDGIIDQFGETTQLKYTTKKLKAAISQIQELPLNAQRNILARNLSQWQGNEPQTDDMLLMGFKFTEEDFQKAREEANNHYVKQHLLN